MNNDDILEQISYLDFAPSQYTSDRGAKASKEMADFLSAAMRLELARAGQWQHTEDLDSRVAALESHVERMMRMMANQQRLPSVQYVVHIPTREWLLPADPVSTIKAPVLM